MHEPWCNRVTGRRFPYDGCDCGKPDADVRMRRGLMAVAGKEPTVVPTPPALPPTLYAQIALRDLRIVELEQMVARLQTVALRVRNFIDRPEVSVTDDGDPTNATWTELSEFDRELHATGVLKDEPKLRRVK